MTLALELGMPVLGTGIVTGLVYALLAIGLLLIYRTTRVIHFGYGEVGAFGALVLAVLVLDHGWSWWLAFPVVALLGAVISAGWERLVIRRLFDAPRIVVLVATIGIAQVMFASQLLLPETDSSSLYPTPLDVRHDLGGFLLRGDHLLVLVGVPLLAGCLAWFLNRTLWGLTLRASAQNPDAATLAGVPVRRLSTLTWALAGALATVTFVLILPVRGVVLGQSTQALGASLLLRALVIGLAGRMESLALAGGFGLLFGVVESVVVANVESSGAVDGLVFIVVVLLLLVRGLGASAGEDPARGWLQGRSRRDDTVARALRRVVIGAGALAAIAPPLLTDSPGRLFAFASVAVFALVGLSVVVVTGWAGQLSLCQFAFVGLGAVATSGLTARGMSFGWATFYAVVLSVAAATAVGFPALRIRGLFLAAATLGFAVASQGWLLGNSVFENAQGGREVARATIGPLDLADQRTFYFVTISIVAIVAAMLTGLQRTGIGRAVVAVRDNQRAASAASVAPARTKLLAFALSGGIAGLAGALYGALFVVVRVGDFGPERSLSVLTMVVIGGVGSVAGAILGALYLVGMPELFGYGPAVTLLTSGGGVLVVLLFSRGGLVEFFQRARDRIVPPHEPGGDAGVRGGADVRPPTDAGAAIRPYEERTLDGANDAALVCHEVCVRFGGLVANDNVSLEVRANEVVGLIGTNGAGKSTLLNAVGGFASISSGSVTVFDEDVTQWRPHERARLGIGRVFQDAGLFTELSVLDCVLVALEARVASEFVPSALRLPSSVRSERWKLSTAGDLVDLMGLGGYARTRVAELSTGTRRILELACVLAARPRLVLLDEPTAGIAQAEVEAFAGVLLRVRDDLDASLLLVEHDMPLVMAVSDRVACMANGRVIAEGSPEDISAAAHCNST